MLRDVPISPKLSFPLPLAGELVARAHIEVPSRGCADWQAGDRAIRKEEQRRPIPGECRRAFKEAGVDSTAPRFGRLHSDISPGVLSRGSCGNPQVAAGSCFSRKDHFQTIPADGGSCVALSSAQLHDKGRESPRAVGLASRGVDVEVTHPRSIAEKVEDRCPTFIFDIRGPSIVNTGIDDTEQRLPWLTAEVVDIFGWPPPEVVAPILAPREIQVGAAAAIGCPCAVEEQQVTID